MHNTQTLIHTLKPAPPSSARAGLEPLMHWSDHGDVHAYTADFNGHSPARRNEAGQHIYFIVTGNFTFTIDGNIKTLSENEIITIPRNVLFEFTGQGRLSEITCRCNTDPS